MCRNGKLNVIESSVSFVKKSLNHMWIWKIFLSPHILLLLTFLKTVSHVFEWWIFPTACGKQPVDNIFTGNIHTILETVHAALLEMQSTIFADRLGKKLPRRLTDQHSTTRAARVEKKGNVSSLFCYIRRSKTWWRNQSDCFMLHFHSKWNETRRSVIA